MSQKEFASVLDCDILTKEEIVLMMKHYSGFGLELPFTNSLRLIEFTDLKSLAVPLMHPGPALANLLMPLI